MAEADSKIFSKDVAPAFPAPLAEEQAINYHRDWTADDERKAKRKLDLIIMPLLTLGFFCLREFGPTIWLCRLHNAN